MPKRIVDGEGLWRSDKLAEVTPAWIKAEYANLVPLALANGSFEANPRRIWSTFSTSFEHFRCELNRKKSKLERKRLVSSTDAGRLECGHADTGSPT